MGQLRAGDGHDARSSHLHADPSTRLRSRASSCWPSLGDRGAAASSSCCACSPSRRPARFDDRADTGQELRHRRDRPLRQPAQRCAAVLRLAPGLRSLEFRQHLRPGPAQRLSQAFAVLWLARRHLLPAADHRHHHRGLQVRCSSARHGRMPRSSLFCAFIGTVIQGVQIDTDHWRHFYWMLGMIWGSMQRLPPMWCRRGGQFPSQPDTLLHTPSLRAMSGVLS